MKFYVYQLLNPITNTPFYVGKGSGKRAWSHASLKDGNNNPYKDRYIKNLQNQNIEPVVEILQYFDDENEAYNYEKILIESIGLENLTNLVLGAQPPSKKGWRPSDETLAKRSRGLKGIPRNEVWRQNLSLAKQGKNNPMYGKKKPCTESRRMALIKVKNQTKFDLYKEAILLLDAGHSVKSVCEKLNLGKGICFRLKNRSHGIFQAYPELA